MPLSVSTILIPVDGTPRSTRTVEAAILMAQKFDARIVMVHVRPKVPDFVGESYRQEALGKLMEKVETSLKPFREILAASCVPYRERILEGDPAAGILQAAKEECADLIVMGTRGLTDLAGMFVGSVSHKVIHASPCKILIVP